MSSLLMAKHATFSTRRVPAEVKIQCQQIRIARTSRVHLRMAHGRAQKFSLTILLFRRYASEFKAMAAQTTIPSRYLLIGRDRRLASSSRDLNRTCAG